MEQLQLTNKETMTSLEVSELINKRHADVMRDIRNLIEQGVAERNFALGTYKDKNQQLRPLYILTKKGSLILASGYDALLREKIIDRWEELEIKQRNITPQIPQNFAEALRLAAAQAEEIEKQQLLLEQQAPKVLFADAVSCSDKDILIGQLSTILQQNGVKNMGQNRLFAYLRENDYLCSSGDRYNLPQQKSLDLQLFRVKTITIQQSDGSVRATNTTKVTPKGQVYFVNKFLKNKIV